MWSKPKKEKYQNVKTEVSGLSFSSKLEASVFQILMLREKAGEIQFIQTQDHVYLTHARVLYIPDFKCRDLKTGNDFWVEAKGFETPKWPIIKKLWQFYGPGTLEIWMGHHIRPSLVKTIIPTTL